MLGRSTYKKIEVAAEPDHVAKDKVRGVVDVSLVTLEAGNNFLKQDVRPDRRRHTAQSDPVIGLIG